MYRRRLVDCVRKRTTINIGGNGGVRTMWRAINCVLYRVQGGCCAELKRVVVAMCTDVHHAPSQGNSISCCPCPLGLIHAVVSTNRNATRV